MSHGLGYVLWGRGASSQRSQANPAPATMSRFLHISSTSSTGCAVLGPGCTQRLPVQAAQHKRIQTRRMCPHHVWLSVCHSSGVCRCAAAGVAGCTEHAYRAHCGQPVSLASELLVLQTLSGACREQLGVLPTSMAEDVQLMMQAAAAAPAADEATAAEGGACHDLAVRWRTGYKAALTSCAERCEALVAACLRCMV